MAGTWEMCKTVKASYGTIVTALNDIHQNTHEPEALDLSKAFSKQSTVAAIYMLDYVLPQVAKLSRTLQTEHLDLSVISSLVDATLHTLGDTVLQSANWVLELLDKREHLEEAARIKVTLADIITFQEKAAKPLIARLKENISSRFYVLKWYRVSAEHLRSQKSSRGRLTWPTLVWWTSNYYTPGTLRSRETCRDIAWWANKQGSCHYLRHYHRVENIPSAVSNQAWK